MVKPRTRRVFCKHKINSRIVHVTKDEKMTVNLHSKVKTRGVRGPTSS